MTEDGVEKEWELPRDYYYWWIVHPRLDGEPLHDIRPDTGKFAGYPLALTYKEFYLFNPEATKNYMDHYVFRDPPPYDKGHKGLQEIPIEDWQDWGPSSRGAFTDLVIGPNHITRDSLGRTTTIEFKIRQKGVILATTLLLEKGYADGNCDALETFIRYGAGNTPAVAEHPHVIVMDEAPFGLDGLIESVLDDFDVNYTVITSAELPEYDLTGVRKVIIPSDQPLALYQAIADNRDKLEEWLKTNWNILQIQGAVSSVDKDWSGIIMPGGFTVEGVADEDDDVVTVEGQPPLTRIIANTTSVWDNQEWNLSGDRLYDPDTFAIDKVTFWSSQNIWDSIGDFAAKHPWFPPERAVQAVRVAFNHYGNCGENQDIVTAASRTCLIPASNTNNGPEDHVWSEFYINDGWHTYQIGWSDDGANIDNPGISSGARHGGGKNNSFIVQYRGDGKLNNRTDYYHYTGDLIVNVVDPEGHPIQGAWVLIGTETFYKVDGEYPLTIGFWDFTDENGQVTIQLGANVVDDLETNCYDQETEYRCNSYYMKVLTYAGEYPAGSEQIKDWAHVVEYEEAFPDFTKEITVEVAGVFPSYRPSQVTDTAQETIPEKAIKVTLDETVEMVCGLGAIAGRYCDAYADGTIDFYVLDQANFDKLAAGEPFDALAAEEDVGTEFEFLASAPANEDWYLLLAHQYRFQHDMLINARFEVLEGTPPAADDPAIADGPPAEDLTEQPQDDSAAQPNDADTEPDAASSGEGGKKKKGSCSAGNHSEANGLGLILLLLLGGLMVILRRRSGSFIA